MPIWGNEYKTIASGGGYYDTGIRGMDSIPYNDPEAFTRAKILALTEYVYRLQAK